MKKDISEHMAATLKRYRENVGLTVYEVGEKIGKSGKTVSAWEHGRGKPDADTFLVLCELYHVESVGVFYGEEIDAAAELVPEEKEVIELWRGLNEVGKSAVLSVMKNPDFQKDILKSTAI